VVFQPSTLAWRQFYIFACWELGISNVGHVAVELFMTMARRDEGKVKALCHEDVEEWRL
jgi:uncharacterized metal-binding protein